MIDLHKEEKKRLTSSDEEGKESNDRGGELFD